jgi:PBP1b-binding outer membrane lipoprotein LpoB
MKALRILSALGVLLLAGCMGSDPAGPTSPVLSNQAQTADSTSTYGVERGPNLMGSGN